MTRKPSDKELLERCRRGDEAAWELLIRRYAGLVRSTCVKFGARGVDVGVFTQNVFGEFTLSIHRIRKANALPRWFTVAASRITRRELEKSGRWTVELDERWADPDGGPEHHFTLLERRHRVEMALRWLGNRCEALLRALFMEEPRPSYAQVAQRLDLKENSVGPTRDRCLKKLKTLLEED